MDDIIEEVTVFRHKGSKAVVETYDFRQGVASTINWLASKGVFVSPEGISMDVKEDETYDLKTA